MNGIRIDELDSTTLPSADHEFPAMKDGVSVKLTIAQIVQVAVQMGLVSEDDLGDAAFLNVGATAGTVAAGDDSRLSDAREWTADVVSQAEAEAGTSTTARKWTAERVRQNVESALGYPKILINTRDGASSPIPILKGYGITSITKLGTGEFRINFSQPFADTNYIFVATAGSGSGVTTARVVAESEDKRLTTSTEIQIWGVRADLANKVDYALLSFAIYGD